MSAKDEFELEKNRIDIATGEEIIFLEKIVVVLEPDLGEFRRIPRQVRGNAGAGLPGVISGERRFLHMKMIAADSDDPAFLESPEHLGI